MDNPDSDAARQINEAWLCGDVVNWQPVARASAFALSTHRDPELKAKYLAGLSAVCGMVISVPFGFGFAAFPVAASFFGATYLTMIFVSAAANEEAFRRLALAGLQWRARVDELGGSDCADLLEKTGIPHEHDVALAVKASRTWVLDKSKDNKNNKNIDLNAPSAMGSLCLTAATAWAGFLDAGKWARQKRLEALAQVDGTAVGRHFLPKKIAQIEQADIESALGVCKASRSGPKRM